MYDDTQPPSTRSVNIVPYRGAVSRGCREALFGQKSAVLWFTGLPGSGKSTIAHAVEERLHGMGRLTYVFDGDNVRSGLCSDLGFEPQDRVENLRRIGEMVKLFLDAGIICLTAFISPREEDRERMKSLLNPGDFFEVYVRCPLSVCEERDVKGLYKKARAGEIANYTGISAPYDEPLSPDLIVDSHQSSLEECVERVIELIRMRGLILKPHS